MAVVKACKGGGSLGRALDYAGREGITSGKDCPDNPKEALEQMRVTKEIHYRTEGRQYKHYVQSFDPKDIITPEKANQLGRQWTEKCFPGYEVFVGTHADREHIHNHIVVNSVNFQNGKKLQVSAKDLERFKQENDRICQREGLSVPEKGQRQEITTWNMNKQKLLERINKAENVKSYVLGTAVAVQTAAGKAGNKQQFILEMEGMGYKVDWQDHRKNVTFTDGNGRKVRLKNLAQTFKEPIFTKEGLNNAFRGVKDQCRENQEGGRGAVKGRGGYDGSKSWPAGIRPSSSGSAEASGISAVNKSVGHIQRTLQQLQDRARGIPEGSGSQGHGLGRKQLNLRERDQERD